MTLTRNVPINRRLLGLSVDPEGQREFGELRARWDSLHTVRIVLDVVGLGLTALGALSRRPG